MTGVLRVVLVETAPPGQQGSMPNYANLLADSLSSQRKTVVTRVNLALPASVLRSVPRRLRNAVHYAWMRVSAAHKLRRIDADVFHIVDGSQGHLVRRMPPGRTCITAHDVIPLLQLEGRIAGPLPPRRARWLIRKSITGLGAADRVIAVSCNTRHDLEALAGLNGDRVAVVPSALPLGVLEAIRSTTPPAWPERRSRPDAFVLHVGNDGFYKNRDGVLRIFARIRERCDVSLRMAGAPPSDRLRRLAGELGVADHVDFEIDPDFRHLVSLYRNACLFLFPSLYEGFGWPPLEAMAFGCPVVCSSAGSLQEVVGDAALTASPDDESGLAEMAARVLSDPAVADTMIRRGREHVRAFDRRRMGEQIRAVYREVTGR